MADKDSLMQGFTRLVMQEASSKKKAILDDAKREKEELLKKREETFLEQAYLKVQDAVRETKKIRNEDYSKAVLESKKQLLQVRSSIMNEVFDNVIKRLRAFRRSDEYSTWLEKQIISGIEKIKDNEYLILCEEADKNIVEKIIKKHKINAKVEGALEEVEGGVIIKSTEKNLLIDLTLKNMIEEAKVDFLSYCGL